MLFVPMKLLGLRMPKDPLRSEAVTEGLAMGVDAVVRQIPGIFYACRSFALSVVAAPLLAVRMGGGKCLRT